MSRSKKWVPRPTWLRGLMPCALLLSFGCRQPAADAPPAEVPGDPTTQESPAADAAAQDAWPETGPIDYRRESRVDLTGDDIPETVIAVAHGRAYDSLNIALTILGETGDTLWHESWPSLLYFKYDPLEGKADSTVRRMVRHPVDQLTERDRFNMEGGLPPVLRRGGDPEAIMREAVHYHLAELDWRRAAGLSPAVATPPAAYGEISTDSVARERVDAVLDEVRSLPSFMYYAGGEATYVITWSQRENAFVRIYSCC